jgi:hypothetical protein
MEFVGVTGKKMKNKSIAYSFTQTLGSSDFMLFWGAGILSFLRRLFLLIVFVRFAGYHWKDFGEILHEVTGVIFGEEVSDVVSVRPKGSFTAIYASNFI